MQYKRCAACQNLQDAGLETLGNCRERLIDSREKNLSSRVYVILPCQFRYSILCTVAEAWNAAEVYIQHTDVVVYEAYSTPRDICTKALLSWLNLGCIELRRRGRTVRSG